MMQECCMILGFFGIWKLMPSADAIIWGPGIPSQSSPLGALAEPSPYSINGSIQQFNEFCKSVCRVAFWRYRRLLQVHGSQKKKKS